MARNANTTWTILLSLSNGPTTRSCSNIFPEKKHRFLADITYHLEAILHPLSPNQPKLKYKHKIAINEPPTMLAQTQNLSKTTALSSWCCSKGSANLFCSFQKNVYVPGEVANVQIELDNRSSQLTCTSINFRLKQVVKLRTHQHETERTIDIVTRQVPGVAASQMGARQIISLNLPAAEETSLWLLKSQGDFEKVILSEYGHSDGLCPTTHGKLIKSEFYLDVNCNMDGCCSNLPDISIPVDIHAPFFCKQ